MLLKEKQILVLKVKLSKETILERNNLKKAILTRNQVILMKMMAKYLIKRQKESSKLKVLKI